jgi:hypothetical protein
LISIDIVSIYGIILLEAQCYIKEQGNDRAKGRGESGGCGGAGVTQFG